MDILNSIKAIIILQTDGKRAITRYFDNNFTSTPRQFERNLFTKTKSPKVKDEIIALDGVLVVHRFVIDSHIYVVGGRQENPLILDSLLNCLVEVIGHLSSNDSKVGGNTVLNNLDRVILALDEVCESGLILETDSKLVLDRIYPQERESTESLGQAASRLFRNLVS